MRRAKRGTCAACGKDVAITKYKQAQNHYSEGHLCLGRHRPCKEHPSERLIAKLIEDCRTTFFGRSWVIDEVQAEAEGIPPYVDAAAAVRMTVPWNFGQLLNILQALKDTSRGVDPAETGLPYPETQSIDHWVHWLVLLALEPILSEVEDVRSEVDRRNAKLMELLATSA